jgi:hypothetical protein
MRKRDLSENMVRCIKKMYEGIKFGVKCDGDNVTNFVEHKRGVRYGCSLSPHLISIFIDDVVDYINEGNTHVPAVDKMSIPGLLFADDLAIGHSQLMGCRRGLIN